MGPPDPQRIASLVPAATETLYLLGAWQRVVAITHECDFPPTLVDEVPRVTRSRVDARLPAAQLDAAVRAISQKGESVLQIDAKRLAAAKPDLLVAQTTCDVCAVTPDDLASVRDRLPGRPDIEDFTARTYEEVLATIRTLGKRIGALEGAKQAILHQWQLAKEIRGRTKDLDHPKVAVLDWLDPIMFAGHWTKELVTMAGGEYELVDTGKPSRWGTMDELVAAAPDVILAAPCGRGLDGSAEEVKKLLRGPKARSIPAVKNDAVWVADGNAYFNRPGPRLIYAAALLSRTLHEEIPPLPESLEAGLAHVSLKR